MTADIGLISLDFFAGLDLEAYWTALEAHIGRHLQSLGALARQGGDS